jgi:hypothetical protein
MSIGFARDFLATAGGLLLWAVVAIVVNVYKPALSTAAPVATEHIVSNDKWESRWTDLRTKVLMTHKHIPTGRCFVSVHGYIIEGIAGQPTGGLVETDAQVCK